jgi:DnaJ-class molecular chaperone
MNEENEFYVCNECTGKGYQKEKRDVYVRICPKCKGAGRLDWIENIVGKKSRNKIYFDPTKFR